MRELIVELQYTVSSDIIFSADDLLEIIKRKLVGYCYNAHVVRGINRITRRSPIFWDVRGIYSCDVMFEATCIRIERGQIMVLRYEGISDETLLARSILPDDPRCIFNLTQSPSTLALIAGTAIPVMIDSSFHPPLSHIVDGACHVVEPENERPWFVIASNDVPASRTSKDIEQLALHMLKLLTDLETLYGAEVDYFRTIFSPPTIRAIAPSEEIELITASRTTEQLVEHVSALKKIFVLNCMSIKPTLACIDRPPRITPIAMHAIDIIAKRMNECVGMLEATIGLSQLYDAKKLYDANIMWLVIAGHRHEAAAVGPPVAAATATAPATTAPIAH